MDGFPYNISSAQCVQYDSPVVKTENPKTTFPKLKNYFPSLFWDENFKTCFGFHFPALETLFLEHWKSVKITRKSQIYSLKITDSSKIMFFFQPNKLGQINVKCYNKTQILRHVSACSVGRKTVQSTHCAVQTQSFDTFWYKLFEWFEIYTFAYGSNILSSVIWKSYFWTESVQGLNLQDLLQNILTNALRGITLGWK